MSYNAPLVLVILDKIDKIMCEYIYIHMTLFLLVIVILCILLFYIIILHSYYNPFFCSKGYKENKFMEIQMAILLKTQLSK